MSDSEVDEVLCAVADLDLRDDEHDARARVVARLRETLPSAASAETVASPRRRALGRSRVRRAKAPDSATGVDADADTAVPAPSRRWNRRRGTSIGLASATLAVVIVVVLALSGTSGGGRHLDVLAQARAALAPDGQIVHMKITVSWPGPARTQSTTTEQWSATNPARWRLVQVIPPAGSPNAVGSFGDAHGPIHGREEFSYADGEQRSYIAERDTLDVGQGYAEDGPAARAPGILGLPGGDPASSLRAALDAGTVRDEGLRQVDGRTVRRLVSDTSTRGLHRVLTYDVDPGSFAPIGGELEMGGPPRTPPVVMHFHVDTYERLPLDADTAKLLTIATDAATKVTVHTKAQIVAQEREAQKGCRPNPNGFGKICPAPRGRVAP